MDANQLLFYMRGVFENTAKPSKEVWANLQSEVLKAKIVEATIVPVEVRNPMATPPSFLRTPTEDGCGCDEPFKGESTVAPVLRTDKL